MVLHEKLEDSFGKGREYKFNKKLPICYFFEEQLALTPNANAVTFHNKSISFKELNKQANKLANYLTRQGANSGDPIAIYLEQGFSRIIAILAILKIGAYYVPLDISYPVERVIFMLNDSAARILITDFPHEIFRNLPIAIISFDTIQNILIRESELFEHISQGSDLAYVIYTSGSTGVPKGVKISHSAVNNHMLWMKDVFRFNTSDRILQKTPLSFDPAVWEIMIPWYTGCELILASAGLHSDPDSMIELIIQYKITIIQLVPSILKLVLEKQKIKECSTLKYIFVGGESLRPEIKKLFFDTLSCQLVNLYGPTEATIDITAHVVARSDIDINNIGRSIYNTQLYVLNQNCQMVNVGEEGELFISGDSLSDGYHNREILTQDYFIPNHLSKKYSIMYRTGDIVRWLASGELEYIGRNNEQVKINGVRIEPMELVLTILQHANISNCIVIKRIDSHGHDFLACYLTTLVGKEPDVGAIKRDLKNKFPSYMLPKTYMIIEELPLTVNGKIDHSALPIPDFKLELHHNPAELDDDIHQLLLIWQNVLEVTQIDVDDNFFDIGGGSLLALRLLATIQNSFKIDLKIRDIILCSTINEQINLIRKKKIFI